MTYVKHWGKWALLLSTGVIAIGSNTPLLAQANSQSVTIVMPGSPDRLDPCETPRSLVGRIIKQNVVETLVELDYQNASTLPRLATSWEQTSPTEWVFHLREGVSFHDGAPFDANAVVYTLERTLDPALTCITRTKYFDGNDILAEAIDDYTVRFRTGAPIPILPTLLAQLAISSPNTPKGEYTATPIGTGPYLFESWTQGTNVKLARNDTYWSDTPEIDEATYVWRSESSVAAAMVETGEADLAFSIAPQDADDPEMDKVYPNSDTSMFRLSVDVPPLNDIRVRKAVNLAIDREAFLGTIISDQAQLATQQIGPNVFGWNADLKPWSYDPKAAMRLLAEARADGVPVDTEIRLVGRGNMFSNSNELVEATAQMLRAVGFTVQIESLEMSLWLDVANKPFSEDREPTMLLTQHDNNSGDAAFTLFFKYHSDGRQSELHDPALDALIVEAGALSGDERKVAYNEATRMIYEDIVSDVPLFHMVNYMRINPRIDFTPSIANAAELQLSELKYR
ncbi:ABC transporter substrate-binding protein [Puniceibacterium sp. IMCC21224]|uniref:ABC transporter substrate-binding protein n=1 Tax=Puniceibacterium sp. IMCC21224 TaxID=1618204 RepID=UPI00064E14AC|nr:ABC transporter substrate-binding protein [Puniceibacterium sp. IMCC21224]KMK69071.1 ABC-type dipeptide transport system, periplasmic component [Puniceibacterium sp. IMCC21224]